MDNIFASNATPECGVVAEDHPLDARFTILLIAESLVFLLGVPGNCLILRVYWTKTRKTSTDILIRALAWADLAVCLLRIPAKVISLLLTGKYLPCSLFLGLTDAFIAAFNDVTVVSSFSITAVIAVERYDCVCRPQKRIFNPRRSKVAVLVAVLLAIATSAGQLALDVCKASGTIPPSLQVYGEIEEIFKSVSVVIVLVTMGACYGKVYATIRKHVKVGPAQASTSRDECKPSVERQVVCSTRPTPPPQNNELPTRESYVNEAVTKIVNRRSTCPTTEVDSYKRKSSDACTSAHVVSLAQQDSSGPSQPNVIAEPKAKTAPQDNSPSLRQSRPEPGHAPRRVGAAKLQRKTTRMLFITSVVFLLTWLPYLIYAVRSYASPHDQLAEIIEDISITLLINSVVNPLIYGIANRRFRKDCKEVIPKIKCCKCS
ncbi:gastrin/cholecystokinin type B receptor-like [Patiria miniata]|uniref:G-protein coupled receptors family 1 profile domain-containing protein n=1 Tax=Patiria miniata TaxID=46514 RepID=A0A914AM85_PATMI|nr:gastrin/cholecystokinin type B receptor-like [Patiria miniata]